MDILSQIGNKFDILALSDTWFSPDKIFFLRNYRILPSNKSGTDKELHFFY